MALFKNGICQKTERDRSELELQPSGYFGNKIVIIIIKEGAKKTWPPND